MPERPALDEEARDADVEDAHPIHDVSKIDVATTTDKGARYGLVIAEPARGDATTQRRLLDKLEAYIGDFYSPRFASEYGQPTPEYCCITVAIHRESDPSIFELLERCRPWVEGNHISFRVTTNLGGIAWH